MSASKRPATNDKVAPIKKNVVTEDIVAVVDSISNWVAKHGGKSTNVASIIDISVVSAVGSLIHGAINHNALPVENDGVDKLPSTINNATSHNTSSKAQGSSTNSKAFSLVHDLQAPDGTLLRLELALVAVGNPVRTAHRFVLLSTG